MGIEDILASIDREIARLQKARGLLHGGTAPSRGGPFRRRNVGSSTAKTRAGKPTRRASVVEVPLTRKIDHVKIVTNPKSGKFVGREFVHRKRGGGTDDGGYNVTKKGD